MFWDEVYEPLEIRLTPCSNYLFYEFVYLSAPFSSGYPMGVFKEYFNAS